jgi:hypothetical protein
MRSRYTFSRKGHTGSLALRSSLYSCASMRERCGPAAARMVHVIALLSASGGGIVCVCVCVGYRGVGQMGGWTRAGGGV